MGLVLNVTNMLVLCRLDAVMVDAPEEFLRWWDDNAVVVEALLVFRL